MLAVLVVIALAALAAYAVFAPPTTVSVNTGTRTTPAQTSPAPTPAEPEGNEEVARAVTEPDPSQYSFWLASRSAGLSPSS